MQAYTTFLWASTELNISEGEVNHDTSMGLIPKALVGTQDAGALPLPQVRGAQLCRRSQPTRAMWHNLWPASICCCAMPCAGRRNAAAGQWQLARQP